jgi:hypothetical protein
MPIVTLEDEDGSTNEVEVPADAIEVQEDEDLILKSQADYDSMLQSRLSRKENSVREELRNDEEFLQEAMQDTFGVELREDGRPKGSPQDDELEELRRKASKAESLEEQVQEYEEQIEDTRRTRAWGKIQEVAPNVREGAAEDVKAAAFRRMSWDEEYGWVKTDEDGNVVYDAGEPVGIEGVTEELTNEKEYLFESTEMQGGPEDNPGSTSPSGETMTREQFEQEVEQATSDERLAELEEMQAEGKIID